MERPGHVQDVALGEVIGGYRLERLIGAGSTSKVFLGNHALLNRTAAIKVLEPELISKEDVVARLLNEARVVNDVRHPNIVDIMDFIVTDAPKRVALVMELVEGPSLKALRGTPLAFPQAMGIALQLVEALAAAHAAGVIHRDIKPDNLLLTSDPRGDALVTPRLKVVDFGIAKLAGSGGKTATGMMLGTPAYMAPEQIAGRPPPSPATDVFAVGEVLYELLTGTRLYPAVAIPETVRTKLRGDLPPLELPPMPGEKVLRTLIERCLALRPGDRAPLSEVRRVLLEVASAPEAERGSLRPGARAELAEAPRPRLRTPPPSPPASARELPRAPTPVPSTPSSETTRERPRTPPRASSGVDPTPSSETARDSSRMPPRAPKVMLPADVPTQDVGAFRVQAIKVLEHVLPRARALARQDVLPSLAIPPHDTLPPSDATDRMPAQGQDDTSSIEEPPAYASTDDTTSDERTHEQGRITVTHLSRTIVAGRDFPQPAETELLESIPTQRMRSGIRSAPRGVVPASTDVTGAGPADPESVDMPATQYGLEALDAKTAQLPRVPHAQRVVEHPAPRGVAPRAARAAEPRAAEPREPRAVEPRESRAVEPRESRAVEPREPRAVEPREPRAVEPREPRAVEPREPREPRAAEPREPRAAEPREPREPRAAEPREPRATERRVVERRAGDRPSEPRLHARRQHDAALMAPSITPREAPIRPIADELAARRRRLLGIGIGVVWLVACALLILSVVLRARSEPEKGSSVLRPAVRASSRIEAAPASPGVGNSPASGHADDRVD